MPLGVANDWRVERSLVGTWKSSVPLHGSLNRAKKRRNLRVRTLNQKSHAQPFWFKATYIPVSNRAFLRSINLYTPQFAPQPLGPQVRP